MELWPAIDIRGGRCVRLYRGDFAAETSFGEPLEVAAQYATAGARRLHVVDLDGALTGSQLNRETVLAIAAASGLVVQAGGGIRDERSAVALLEGGVERVVLGTAALSSEGLLERLAARFPGRIVAGLDYRGDRRELAVSGWTATSGLRIEEVLWRLEELPLAGVVATGISRDGTGDGPDLGTYSALLGMTALRLVASGGVGSVGDLLGLASLEEAGRRLSGVIVGRALLAGELTVQEAARAAGEEGG